MDDTYQLISVTDYWENFHKNHPDLSPLVKLATKHPSLTKIFLFSSVPTVWGNLKKYPLAKKLKELKFISEEDENYLTSRIVQLGLSKRVEEAEWLIYLYKLYRLVCGTIRLWELFEEKNKLVPKPILPEDLSGFIKHGFEVLQQDILETYTGATVHWSGLMYPYLIQSVTKTPTKTIYRAHIDSTWFPNSPKNEEIEKAFREFDKVSVLHAQRFKDIDLEHYIGNIDEIVDQIWPSSPQRTDIEWYKDLRRIKHSYTWEIWHNGTRFKVGKFKSAQPFRVLERYIPLMRKIIENLMERYSRFFEFDKEQNIITVEPSGWSTLEEKKSVDAAHRLSEIAERNDEYTEEKRDKEKQIIRKGWDRTFIDKRNRDLALGPHEDLKPNIPEDTWRFILAHELVEYLLRKTQQYDPAYNIFPEGLFERGAFG